MKKIVVIIIVIVASFFYTECSFNGTYVDEASEKIKAEKITEKLYSYISKKDYKRAEKLFSESFFKVTNRQILNNIFIKTNSDLGEYKTKKLIDCKTKRVVGNSPSSEYLLVYDVSYELFKAKETINLLKEGQEIKIIGYNVNSEGFLR